MTKENKNEKQIRNNLKKFYNSAAVSFSGTRRNWWVGFEFIKKHTKSEGKTLDFGCGNGRILEFLEVEKRKIEYVGADLSSGLLEIAKKKYLKRYPKANFVLIENEDELPFADNSFDSVVSVAVFHHFSPKMAEKSLKELRRILKNDGMLIITAWNLWEKKSWEKYKKYFWKSFWRGKVFSSKLPFQDSKTKKKHFRYVYWWRKNSLKKLIKKAGFEIVEDGFSLDQNNRKRNVYVVGKKA